MQDKSSQFREKLCVFYIILYKYLPVEDILISTYLMYDSYFKFCGKLASAILWM